MNENTTVPAASVLTGTKTSWEPISDRTPLQPIAGTHGFPHADQVVIYVAASAAGFGGGAGSAAVLCRVDAEGNHLKDPARVIARHRQATAPRMELLAVILGLEALEASPGLPVILRSSSDTVVKGLNEWLPGWKARGWKKANKKPPENLPEWQAIDQLISALTVKAERPDPDGWLTLTTDGARTGAERAVQEFLNG